MCINVWTIQAPEEKLTTPGILELRRLVIFFLLLGCTDYSRITSKLSYLNYQLNLNSRQAQKFAHGGHF